jgi:hypothetical protein
MDFIKSLIDHFGCTYIEIVHPSSEYIFNYKLNEYFIKERNDPKHGQNFVYMCSKKHCFYYDYNHFLNFKRVRVNTSILNDFVFLLKKNYLVAYHPKDVAANIIKSAWKKNKWNYRRNLAAWKYHPSRLTFEID